MSTLELRHRNCLLNGVGQLIFCQWFTRETVRLSSDSTVCEPQGLIAVSLVLEADVDTVPDVMKVYFMGAW